MGDKEEIMAAKGVNGLCTLMYVPLRQPKLEGTGGSGQAATSTWTLAVSVLAPDAAVAAKEKAAKASNESLEAAEGEESETAGGGGPSCTYEVILQSVTPFQISIDTQRQTAAVELK